MMRFVYIVCFLIASTKESNVGPIDASARDTIADVPMGFEKDNPVTVQPASWVDSLKAIMVRCRKEGALIWPTIFYATSIAILFHAYAQKRSIDEYFKKCLSMERNEREDNVREPPSSVAEIEALRDELDTAMLSEKMLQGKLEEYGNTVTRMSKEIGESKTRLAEQAEEIAGLRAQVADCQSESVNARENAEMMDFQKEKEIAALKQSLAAGQKRNECLENELIKSHCRRDAMEPLLREIGGLMDRMSTLSPTNMDALYLDPLDSNFSEFILEFDRFKADKKACNFKEILDGVNRDADCLFAQLKSDLKEKECEIEKQRTRADDLTNEVNTLKVKLETVDELRQRDRDMYTGHITELQGKLEQLSTESDSLKNANSEVIALRGRTTVLESENASLRMECSQLIESNRTLSDRLERIQMEFRSNHDRLISMNEILRRKVIEKEHDLVRMESPTMAESRHSTPDPVMRSPCLSYRNVSPRVALFQPCHQLYGRPESALPLSPPSGNDALVNSRYSECSSDNRVLSASETVQRSGSRLGRVDTRHPSTLINKGPQPNGMVSGNYFGGVDASKSDPSINSSPLTEQQQGVPMANEYSTHGVIQSPSSCFVPMRAVQNPTQPYLDQRIPPSYGPPPMVWYPMMIPPPVRYSDEYSTSGSDVEEGTDSSVEGSHLPKEPNGNDKAKNDSCDHNTGTTTNV